MGRALYVMFVAFVCLRCVENSVFRAHADDPAHPGKCVFKGIVMSLGENRRYENCSMITCTAQQDGKFIVSGLGCGYAASASHCKILPGDFSKPYPYCCPELVC